MKQISSTKMSATSDRDEAPALTQAQFAKARYRVAGKDVSKDQWQCAVKARVAKQRISIMLDAPIVAHFKAAAGDRGYQTLINDALRRVVEGEHLMSQIKTMIRTEIRNAKRAP